MSIRRRDVANHAKNWAVEALAGATGAQGAQGIQGVQGPIGPMGLQGPAGATGAMGLQGPQGAAGTNGTNGTNGQGFTFRNAYVSGTSYNADDVVTEGGSTYVALQANQNVDPATDVANHGGNWAVEALAGATGAQGAQGIQGVQGPIGPIGPIGLQGPAGVTGATGLQGPQGPAGTNGTNGANGQGFTFRNVYVSGTSYNPDDVVTEGGSTYVALQANQNVDPATDVANHAGNWAVEALAGATGAQGAQGIQGVQGPIGPMGLQGPAGATGATGVQGPQGLQGLQGSQGSAGTNGTNGTNGQGFTFRNAYVSGTSYKADDVVTEGGSTYVALQANQNVDPATDVANHGGNWAGRSTLAGATWEPKVAQGIHRSARPRRTARPYRCNWSSRAGRNEHIWWHLESDWRL